MLFHDKMVSGSRDSCRRKSDGPKEEAVKIFYSQGQNILSLTINPPGGCARFLQGNIYIFHVAKIGAANAKNKDFCRLL